MFFLCESENIVCVCVRECVNSEAHRQAEGLYREAGDEEDAVACDARVQQVLLFLRERGLLFDNLLVRIHCSSR